MCRQHGGVRVDGQLAGQVPARYHMIACGTESGCQLAADGQHGGCIDLPSVCFPSSLAHPLIPRIPLPPSCRPQFGAQEPGSNSEIKSFAERKGFKGPMFAKADVNGPNALPLFNYLKSQQVGPSGISEQGAAG